MSTAQAEGPDKMRNAAGTKANKRAAFFMTDHPDSCRRVGGKSFYIIKEMLMVMLLIHERKSDSSYARSWRRQCTTNRRKRVSYAHTFVFNILYISYHVFSGRG